MNRLSVNGEKRAVHRLGLHLVFLSLIIVHIRRFLYLEQVAVGVHLACNAGVFWVAEIERVAAIFDFMTVEDWGE